MRISYLELRNYRRFKELKLQFPDGVIGILGLNGVGKSTIIEAIAWSLFGNVEEVVRTGKDSIRKTGAQPGDSCSVVLEFELGGTEYRVRREMGGKSLAMKAELRTKDKVIAVDDKPVKRMVEKLLGMDHKSFFTSVFAIQKELNALQNVAPGERKKVVLRMLRIDGLDPVLTNIRADKNASKSRIEGAERTLIDEDGRDREQVLKERLPGLAAARDDALARLAVAEKAAKQIAGEVDSLKARRDELKKDVDAYFAASSDLKGKLAGSEELKKRQKIIEGRITEANAKLQALPELKDREEEWKAAVLRKEALDKEKLKSEKVKMLQADVAANEKEELGILEALQKLKTSIAPAENLVKKIDDVEKSRGDCQATRAEISTKIGALKARVAERKEAAAEDVKKLDEIKGTGRDGKCPTCERKLDDAYDLLVAKLEKSASDATKVVSEASSAVQTLESELRAISSREEALKKKRAVLDNDMQKLRQQETTVEAKEGELVRIRARLTQKKKELAQIGDVAFSDQEYSKLADSYSHLRSLHEEFVALNSLKGQCEHYHKDLEDISERIRRTAGEEETLRGIVKQLEPRKELHESTVRELDQRMTTLNHAKDSVRNIASDKERRESELKETEKALNDIERVRKSIERDRKTGEELALLEEVVVNFKDHLIGRVAPVLSELTSKGLEDMSGGRYARAELSEDYEMSIEDQGVMYPLSRFSGGEADLANLSLRLAISRIIADRTGASPINFLILDEIFGSQDPNRKRSVIGALTRLSSQFRQIFLITHIEDIKDLMSNVIHVEETEDGSSVALLVS